MLTRMLTAALLSITLIVSVPLGAGNFANRPRAPGHPPASSLLVPATLEEAADMLYMREEEKLARDVYLTLDEAWGISPFANIAASEQKHMNAMLLLLRKYQLPDPAAGNAIGEFTDPALQALHDNLVARGLASAAEALQVGGLIEEVDLVDLQAAIDRSAQADIDAVYENLLCGSRNHLRAFARTFEALTGLPYKSQVLDQGAVDAILVSPTAPCVPR